MMTSLQENKDHAPTAFEDMGGEHVIRALVDRFYDVMDLEARFSDLRAMHPQDLSGSRDKLFWFLCGWLGGPDYFVERFGHPRLRARHLPYEIGVKERDDWLHCMAQALHEEGFDEAMQERLLKALLPTADWMRNVPR
jgi:hemoglobin